MKKITTKIKLQLPDAITFEDQLRKEFSASQVKFNVFTGIWEVKNKNFKHSIWYYEDEQSKIITEKIREYKEVMILNICLVVFFGLLVFIKNNKGWDIETEVMFFSFLLFQSLLNWIVMKLKPHYKLNLENEHNYTIKYFSKYKIDSENK